MKTIQTASEIRQHSVVDATYRIEGLCDRILIYEETAFKDCLGLDFYEKLITDLNDIPDEVYDYDEEKSYAVDDYAIYREIIYKCIAASQNEVPENSDKWEKVEKFKTECYNDLYNRYLKVYLSNFAVHNDIVFSTIPAGNKGAMVYEKDSSGSKTVDMEQLYQWRRDANTLYNNALELMKLFLDKNKKNCDFADVVFLNDTCEDCNDEKIERMAWD